MSNDGAMNTTGPATAEPMMKVATTRAAKATRVRPEELGPGGWRRQHGDGPRGGRSVGRRRVGRPTGVVGAGHALGADPGPVVVGHELSHGRPHERLVVAGATPGVGQDVVGILHIAEQRRRPARVGVHLCAQASERSPDLLRAGVGSYVEDLVQGVTRHRSILSPRRHVMRYLCADLTHRPGDRTIRALGRSSSPSGGGEGSPAARGTAGPGQPPAHWRPHCAPTASPG